MLGRSTLLQMDTSGHELKHRGLAARAQSAVDKGLPLEIAGGTGLLSVCHLGDTFFYCVAGTTGVVISELEAAQVLRAIMRLEASTEQFYEKQTAQQKKTTKQTTNNKQTNTTKTCARCAERNEWNAVVSQHILCGLCFSRELCCVVCVC